MFRLFSILFLYSTFFLVSSIRPAWSQATSEQFDPELEEFLREQLKKLERWDIEKLLKTERDIDFQQKKRAILSSNPEELALLAEDEDSGVRFQVAANPYTPLDFQLRLAKDPVSYVKSGLAMGLSYDPLASIESSKVVESIAMQLARDSSPLVRLVLAENEKVPETALNTLANDPDFVIRHRLAQNLYVSQDALVILAQDHIQVVQAEALKHRNMPVVWLERKSEDPSAFIRLAVCQNVNIPLPVLEVLSGDSDPGVRLAVLEHEKTSLEILKQMVADDDLEIVKAVARHPNADRDLLVQLAYDKRDAEIRTSAQKRLEPLLRSEIREDILERWKSK